MLLTRVAIAAVLIGAGCTPMQAQSGQTPGLNLLQPAPQGDRAPNGFDASRYTLILPKPILPSVAAKPLVVRKTFRSNVACAAVRVTRPNPAIDSQMPVGNPKAVESNSKDVGAMKVPAPSCQDFAMATRPQAPQK